ncbi:MAG TPA: ATP-binding protein [Verrucomicrobiae bacterium]|nr:ATP-binding protein [Verrucomicrobiae bacterium]
MSDPATISWPEANQRHLMAALAVVRGALERHAACARGDAPAEDPLVSRRQDLQAATEAMPAPSALDVLCAAFRLSLFERDVLLLCAGVELDSNVPALLAAAHRDPRRTSPTFSLALAALPEAHWSALTPGAPLRRWRLIEMPAGEGLVATPIQIDERVLHFLTGVNGLDARLHGLVEPLSVAADLPRSQMNLARQISELWTRSKREGDLPVVQLCGLDGAGRRAVAAGAGQRLGLRVYVLRHADIPANAAERESLARLWERETILSNGALLVDAEETDAADCARTLLPFLESLRGVVMVSRREPIRSRLKSFVRLEVNPPGPGEQEILWQRSLGELSEQLNGQVARVVTQFSLSPRGIEAACAELKTGTGDAATLGARLWEACRTQARSSLDNLAQRIEPYATWADLVLPEVQRQILREISAHVRQRAKVYEAWGFAGKGARGLGISALFAGISGTGKTMAAEVLANELRLDLHRIDLSSVVSKYIGETEKNLRRVFDAAEEGGAILLFDEADALFGKRSEVKDSHDRYANIEVSYLLQRMETYRGLAILTTNLKDSLDTAFLRRIRFVVQFPFPDAAQRAEIWRRIFPAGTPTEGLDPLKLSRLNVAGGNIRNVAMNAAFLAADAGQPVRMNHLLHAARGEYAKLEKPLTESEIGGWA